MKLAMKDGEKAVVPLKDIVAGKTVPLWQGAAVARLLSSAGSVTGPGDKKDREATEKQELDFPAAAHGPDGALWVAFVGYSVKEEQRRIESPMLKEQPDNFKKYFTPGGGDQLFVRCYRLGEWGPVLNLTEANQDIARCAVAVDKENRAWIAYSAQRDGNFDIYVRDVTLKAPDGKRPPAATLGAEQRLTTSSGPDINPVMCTDKNGDVWLACQSWSDKGQAGIRVFRSQKGTWAEHCLIAGEPGENCWHPSLAADHTGKVAVAYDIYKDQSDYDVHVSIIDVGSGKRQDRVIANSFKL